MDKNRFVLIVGDNKFNRDQELGSRALLDRSSALLRSSPIPVIASVDEEDPSRGELNVLADIDTELGVDAVLVEIEESSRLQLQAKYPDLRVMEEGTAEMAFVRPQLQPIPMPTMASTGTSLAKIKIKVLNPRGKPISRALVQVITNRRTTPPTGCEGTTNAKGEATLAVPRKHSKALLKVEPLHSYWPTAQTISWEGDEEFVAECASASKDDSDSLRHFGSSGGPDDGRGVVVAVVDGGAGPHPGLPDFGGRNYTDPGAPSDDLSDNGIGHGTHVAGIIAGQETDTSPSGMAPGCTLLVYRVYGKNSTSARGFSVAAAIGAAIDARADIINLSLTLPVSDTNVIRQLQRARANGAVCIAAAGNTGGRVCMPASHDAVIGVSAVGCRGCWPKGADYDLEIRKSPKGNNRKHFTAKFSCHGSEIDLTGPGVGIVSLFPKNKIAIMNGTSMAAPAVSGLVARLLAESPGILGMRRDQVRSDRIVALALGAATALGFPATHEGRGILS